jgi:hypothetical protein
MQEIVLYILVAVVVAIAVAYLLLRPGPAKTIGERLPVSPAEFFPVHCRYFPQVRHALSREDAPFLAGRCSPVVYRRWSMAVRHAGRLYLAGLHEDFARLNRLARFVSLYSPRVRGWQEMEILRLQLRFQLLYAIVWWRFALGWPAGERLEQMASLIGSLGRQLELATLPTGLSSGAITP